MTTMTRFGIEWKRTISGWGNYWAGERWRAVRNPGTGFAWKVYRNGHLEYSGSTLLEISARMVADFCPFDHEEHLAECADTPVDARAELAAIHT